MSEFTQNRFIDFVMLQEDDRVIDHAGGWTTCALGEYVSSVFPEFNKKEIIDCCMQTGLDFILFAILMSCKDSTYGDLKVTILRLESLKSLIEDESN